VVALSESDAQAWREGKESRGRCSGGPWGSSLFIGAKRGGSGRWLRRRNGRRYWGQNGLLLTGILLCGWKEGEGETSTGCGAAARGSASVAG
jgi:hypothetical protein